MSAEELNKAPKPKKAPAALVIPDSAFGQPTDFIRTALFAVAKKEPLPLPDTPEWDAAKKNGQVLYARDGMTLKFSGQRLDTYDGDVFTALLKIHAEEKCTVGLRCSTSFYEIAKTIGKGDSKRDVDFLRLRLARLATANLSVVVRKKSKIPLVGYFSLLSVWMNPGEGGVEFAFDALGMDFLDRMTNLEMDVWDKLPSGIPRQLFALVRSNTAKDEPDFYSLEKMAQNFGWEGRRNQFRKRVVDSFELLKLYGVVDEYVQQKGNYIWKTKKFTKPE